LEQAVQMMEKHRIKRLPVVRGSKVVGVLTRANLLHAFASAASKPQAVLATDTAIRKRIIADLERAKWAPLPLINIVVQDGIVNLWGTITDERQRQALIVAAENVPGVKDVKDHLAWVEPMSGMVFLGPEATEPEAPPQKAAS
jgi:CBS domain-containing protein